MTLKQVAETLKANPKKIQAILVAIVLASTIAAVAWPHLAHAGSPETTTPSNGTQFQEQKLTEDNQAVLDNNQPAPRISHSLERDNLIKRINFLNNANQLGYVYLLSLDGKVVAVYTIKGKVSSINSYLTTSEQLRC